MLLPACRHFLLLNMVDLPCLFGALLFFTDHPRIGLFALALGSDEGFLAVIPEVSQLPVFWDFCYGIALEFVFGAML